MTTTTQHQGGGMEVDYGEIDFYLQQAQDEIGQALSVLSPDGSSSAAHMTKPARDSSVSVDTKAAVTTDTSTYPGVDKYCRGYYSLGHPRRKPGLKLDCRQGGSSNSGTSVDFHSIFNSNDTLDEDFFTSLDQRLPTAVDSFPGNHGNSDSVSHTRPDRPQTLTPPITLPKCCNFRNKDWRFYVSGNFNNSRIVADVSSHEADPLDSLLNDTCHQLNVQSKKLSSVGGSVTENGTVSSSTDHPISSPHGYTTPNNLTLGSADSRKAFQVSTTIDAPKASSTYQSLSSSTSDGSTTKFPIEIAKRSTDDEGESKAFIIRDDYPKAFDKSSSGSKSVDDIHKTQCVNGLSSKNSGSVDYVSTRWIISAEDTTQSTPALNNFPQKVMYKPTVHQVSNSQPAMMDYQGSGSVELVPILGMIRQNPEGCEHNSTQHVEKLSVNIQSYDHVSTSTGGQLAPSSPTKIKTNGLLSTRRTMRERRLRVRSDPSTMLSERIKVKQKIDLQSNGARPSSQKCESVQTENFMDGMLSPLSSRKFVTESSSTYDAYDASESTCSSPEDKTFSGFNFPQPLPSRKHEHRSKSSKYRSQSAERVEGRHEGRHRPRDKTSSPERRGHRSVERCASERRSVSRVSRSTQTHRSITRPDKGAPVKVVKGSSGAKCPGGPTIHVQLDDVLGTREEMNKHGSKTAETVTVKREPSTVVKVNAVKEYVTQKPDMIPSVRKEQMPKSPTKHCDRSKQKSVVKIDENVSSVIETTTTAPASSKSSSKHRKSHKGTKMTATKTQVLHESAGGVSSRSLSLECDGVRRSSSELVTEVDGQSVVYVPTRESRRIQVRPQMPVIEEDIQRDEDYSEDTSSATSSLHKSSVRYYGSLKTEYMTTSAAVTDDVSASVLSKSANDVSDKVGKVRSLGEAENSKSLLDKLHRKYYPDQYEIDSQGRVIDRNDDAPTSPKDAMVPKRVQSKTTPYVKDVESMLSGAMIQIKHSDSSSSDMKHSPSCKEQPRISPKLFKSPKPTKCLTVDVTSWQKTAELATLPSPGSQEYGWDEEQLMFDCCRHLSADADSEESPVMFRTERERAEIEAIEACKWLRAAGFPQYAQMYEEHQFPIDVSSVEKDHDFLDTDSIQSLFRRLNTLNKCASMKIDGLSRKATEDSDEEDACALSDKWRYQRSSRRWSRKDLDGVLTSPPGDATGDKLGIRSCSSHDSVITDNEESVTSQTEDSAVLRSPYDPSSVSALDTSVTSGHVSDSDNSSAGAPLSPTVFKRSASERLKSAKNSIFKRMESLKSSSRKGSIKGGSGTRPGKGSMGGKIEISSPVLVETQSVQERMDRLGCKEITSADMSPTLSASSRHTNESDNHNLTGDSDSVFMDAMVTDLVSGDLELDKLRVNSESAVSQLQDKQNEKDILSVRDTHSDSRSQHKPRSSSFSVGNNNYSTSTPLTIKSQSELRLQSETNNNVNKNVEPRLVAMNPNYVPSSEPVLSEKQSDPHVSRRNHDPSSPENRLSVYDNVPFDSQSEAVKELDMIVQTLMQDISELNASWGQSDNMLDGLPLTLEDTLADLSSDKESTLTRKSSRNKVSHEVGIPALAADGANNNVSSRSSSSSTISHSNSSVMAPSQDNHNNSRHGDSNDYQSRHAGDSVTTLDDVFGECQETESSHMHITGFDETLDSILRNLESHYSLGRYRSDSQTSDRSDGRPALPMSESCPDSAVFTRTTDSYTHDSSPTRGGEHEPMDADPDNESISLSNPELSDPETSPGSRDVSPGPRSEAERRAAADTRERRDSGVGSSLTREPSDKRRHRIRWHSFVKSHRPSFNSRDLQINSMSAGQLKLLRKFSLLKVTALMEKYSLNRSGWNWAMPMNKFMRRFKVSADYKDKNVFGVPLLVTLQRTGQALPQCILQAMRCLRKNALDAVGIFRKSGVRSRIQKLRDLIESDPESVGFETLQAYDVADLLKQYFRELPECLLTNKLSETFISIFTHVPSDQRLEALYAAVMLLPDENREVLQSLLLFLSDMADYSKQNQMNASNLAVCFAPSLFHLCGSRNTSSASPKRNRKKDGIPDQRELQEQKAAHECLTEMIIHCKKIFMVPSETLRMCHFSYMDQCSPVGLDELGRRRNGDSGGDPGDYMAYLESCIQGLLKESRDKFKGWVSVSVSGTLAVDLAYKKIDDGYSLRLWKVSVEVEAPPSEVLNRVLRERQAWDEDFIKWRVIETLDEHTDVFQYVVTSMPPHPSRDFCELRHWRTDLPRGACVLVSTSVHHQEAPLMGGVTGVVLASRYLIEPCGSGKSRLTHISRLDLRGHTPEWYNKVYGNLCANYIQRIRDSFMQKADGPETNV